MADATKIGVADATKMGVANARVANATQPLAIPRFLHVWKANVPSYSQNIKLSGIVNA